MYHRFKERFGTAGLVVAMIALIAALAGTAIAAGGLTAKQKKEVKKIAKAFAGKPGPAGPQGPDGPQGPAGSAGKDGLNGKNGVNGTNGAPGKSVVSGAEAAGANCASGGYWFELQGSGNKQYVCNGGGGGSQEVMGYGESQTGFWAVSGKGEAHLYTEISFSPRLRAPLEVDGQGVEAHWIEPGEGPTDKCPGTVDVPKAKPRNLCIYAKLAINTFFPEFPGMGNATNEHMGRVLDFEATDPSAETLAYGSWAVRERCAPPATTC